MGKNGKFDSLDRISNLPTEVLSEILKCLPIKEVVKTSVLSTNWRYKWTLIPELIFNEQSILPSLPAIEDHYKLVKIVDCVLSLHNGTITTFVLDNFLYYDYSDVDRWIVVLSRKMLHHLVLAFLELDYYKVPGSLFTCQSLRSLSLQYCVLTLPSHYHGFGNLSIIKLYSVRLSNKTFEELVLMTPLLKTLRIRECVGLTAINLRHAQNLRCLSMTIWFSGTGSSLIFSVDKVFQGLDELEIGGSVIEYLPINLAPETSQITYQHLKRAYLEVNFEDSKQLLALLFFCRNTPCLEKLEIMVLQGRQSATLIKDHFVTEKNSVLSHLKNIRMDGYLGTKHELEFARYLLLNAVSLETFNISWQDDAVLYDHEKLDVVQKMMQFRRASFKAKVTFLN